MRRSLTIKLIFMCLVVGLVSCTTIDKTDNAAEPPAITKDMPLSDAIHAALTYGDQTLVSVKKLLSKRGQWPQAAQALRALILEHHEKWQSPRLINAFALYQASGDNLAPELFKKIVRSDRRLAQQLVWSLASQLPSPQMAKQIENRLTEAIVDNEISELYIPYMADAIAANQLKDSYTLVRQGLFVTNHVAFARAMAKLKPERASNDFLDYLAMAPVEELRQLNLKTVDALSCMEILTHMTAFPPRISHPKIDALFLFSISRNAALSEMSRQVISGFLPEHASAMASVLVRLPPWVQLAYVEGVRRQYSAVLGLFLAELKKVSAQKEVIDEIDQVVR